MSGFPEFDLFIKKQNMTGTPQEKKVNKLFIFYLFIFFERREEPRGRWKLNATSAAFLSDTVTDWCRSQQLALRLIRKH